MGGGMLINDAARCDSIDTHGKLFHRPTTINPEDGLEHPHGIRIATAGHKKFRTFR